MNPEPDASIDHNDLFVDSAHRVAAVESVRKFRSLGWIPKTINPAPAEITKLEPGNGFTWYAAHYQPTDFGPIVRVGVEISGVVRTRQFANLQASMYPRDGYVMQLALDRSSILHGAPAETLTLLIQTYTPLGERCTQLQYIENITAKTKRLAHDTMTPFGLVTDASADVTNRALPEIAEWPDMTLSLAALRLLDDERARKLFGIWPEHFHPNFGDLDVSETMHELSQRIIQSY